MSDILKLIGKLKFIRDHECKTTAEVKAMNDAITELSKQPEQRWIPVTDGLPEEDDYKSCIECLDGAVWYFTENGTMGLGYYYESVKEWSTTNDLRTDGKVVAWMQLPESYGGEQE